ncbi:MAG: L,D-transpeptidase family protein [Actinomycetota bacterium]|nr:L,D-transpeptidase family protein [Actinomycetota bacterium]
MQRSTLVRLVPATATGLIATTVLSAIALAAADEPPAAASPTSVVSERIAGPLPSSADETGTDTGEEDAGEEDAGATGEVAAPAASAGDALLSPVTPLDRPATAATAEPAASNVDAPTTPRQLVARFSDPNLPDLGRGAEGDVVLAVQERLTELGFRPGEHDGLFGASLSSAVLAFQKYEGIERTSTVGPETYARLDAPQGRSPMLPAKGPFVEVDIERQVAFVVLADGTSRVLNVSTGGGYYYTTAYGSRAFAATPTGFYNVERRIDGIRHAPLGRLYRPLYFRGGYAIHGSPSVPAHPASHGCVRVSNADMDWLFDRIPDDSPVVVRSTTHPYVPLLGGAVADLGATGLGLRTAAGLTPR